jgi:hypothetical protein
VSAGSLAGRLSLMVPGKPRREKRLHGKWMSMMVIYIGILVGE